MFYQKALSQSMHNENTQHEMQKAVFFVEHGVIDHSEISFRPRVRGFFAIDAGQYESANRLRRQSSP